MRDYALRGVVTDWDAKSLNPQHQRGLRYVLWEVTHTGSVVEVEVAVGYCEIFP